MSVSVQNEDFDVGLENRQLQGDDRSIGALVNFVGFVRDVNDNAKVATMHLEHYPGMTEKSILAIIEQAKQRWSILGVRVIHRIGDLKPGDQIVYVGVSSMHRGDAFAACEFVMDYLKTQAPFWKKEYTPEGERWVEARSSDTEAASRWQD
jgi:molybdopterin synthase catalytic subunit